MMQVLVYNHCTLKPSSYDYDRDLCTMKMVPLFGGFYLILL